MSSGRDRWLLDRVVDLGREWDAHRQWRTGRYADLRAVRIVLQSVQGRIAADTAAELLDPTHDALVKKYTGTSGSRPTLDLGPSPSLRSLSWRPPGRSAPPPLERVPSSPTVRADDSLVEGLIHDLTAFAVDPTDRSSPEWAWAFWGAKILRATVPSLAAAQRFVLNDWIHRLELVCHGLARRLTLVEIAAIGALSEEEVSTVIRRERKVVAGDGRLQGLAGARMPGVQSAFLPSRSS